MLSMCSLFIYSSNVLKFCPWFSVLQIYDSPESELKLNDVFEFVGVLTFDTELATDTIDNDEIDAVFCEAEKSNLASSKVLINFIDFPFMIIISFS